MLSLSAIALFSGYGNSGQKEPVSERFALVEKNLPMSVILLPESASDELIKDVEYFNGELQKSFGTALPVVKTAPAAGNRIEFIVEKSAFIERGKYSITFPDPQTLKITCSNISVRWALNHMLEKAGIRYLFPGADGAYYPQLAEFNLPRQTVKSDASYKLYRGLFGEDQEWQLNLNCEGGDSYQFFNHNMDNIFPIEKYSKGEWIEKIMSLHDGKRDTSPTKFAWEPCYSNPATAEEAIKNICTYFEKHPGCHTYSLTINDGMKPFCECDTCREANKGPKTDLAPFIQRLNYSECYYKWVNKVVEGVISKYPDKYFGLLAYTGVVNPPSFKLHPNVAATICFDPYVCVDPDADRQWKGVIQEWKKKASILGIWDYAFGIDAYTLPRVYFRQQATILRYLNQQGGEVGFNQSMPAIGEGPKRYLYLKLFYNADIDVEHTLRDWYEAAVGKAAAPYLEQYYSFWEKLWSERATKTSWFQSSKLDTYPCMAADSGYMYALEKGDIAKCRRLMEKVVELAKKNGDKGQQIRAEQLMLEFEFYEASAYMCAAGIVPVSGSLENKTQAIEFAQTVPVIVKYSMRRAEIARQILETSPKKWFGGIYPVNRKIFKDQFCTAKLPEALSLLGGYLNDPEILTAVFKSLEDKSIPADWRNFIVMMVDIASGKIKNILPDGSFEQGKDGWIAAGSPSSEQAATGKQSMKITFFKDGKFEMTRRVPMKPGCQYYLSAKIFIPRDYPPGIVTGNGFILGLNSVNVGTNYYIPPAIPIVPGQWTTITTIANPGPCAGYGDIYLFIKGMRKGESAYIDDMVFVEIEKEVFIPKPASVMIDTDSFSEWTLVDIEQRKDSGKYLNVSGKTVNLISGDKAVQYFNTQSLPISDGGQVDFSFKAEGSGQGQVGFFAYADEKWTSTDGLAFQSFLPEMTSKEYKFALPVKGTKIKAIRVLIGVAPNSSIKYSELKISPNIKN